MNEHSEAANSFVDRKSLVDWLQDQEPVAATTSTLLALADAGKNLAAAINQAPIHGHLGSAGRINVQGEDQQNLDIIAHDLMISAISNVPEVGAMVSEEVEDIIQNDNASTDAKLIVCFDPLDGSSNIATNVTVGSVFSVLQGQNSERRFSESDVFQAACHQIAAGYILYGPATLLVLTLGRSVAMFALDANSHEFCLVQDDLRIPQSTSEFSINVAHRRFWNAAVTSYIDECLLGEAGPRQKQFNMRWVGSMVADVHRLFVRGGIFIYPALRSPGGANGKLRLLYEANPMAFLVTTANGAAIASSRPLEETKFTGLHQRVPLALGSREEVGRLLTKY